VLLHSPGMVAALGNEVRVPDSATQPT
jgi:hypothetical protein